MYLFASSGHALWLCGRFMKVAFNAAKHAEVRWKTSAFV